MNALPQRAPAGVSAAIGAVKDAVALAYRALAAAPPENARARWQEAHGALRIVAHPALVRVSEEMGNLLAHVQNAAPAAAQPAAVKEAGEAILAVMNDIAAGLPARPAHLLPAYRALLLARGVEQANIADLFFPDLALQPPARPAPVAADIEKLRATRRSAEAALLRMLKSPADRQALRAIRALVEAIEESRATPGARAPWTAALAVMKALRHGALEADADLRRFVAQLNLQAGRAIGGADEFPEALFRHALYHVARIPSPAAGSLAAQIRHAYALDGLLEGGEAAAPAIPASAAKDLERLKDGWSAWTQGEAKANDLRAVLDATERPIGAGAGFAADLLPEIRAAMRAQIAAGQPAAAAGVEISCALLMVENLVDDPLRAAQSFARRAANAVARLKAGNDRETLKRLPPMELLDAGARGDEAKQLLAQALAQAESALGQAEAALEAFFADAAKRPLLAALDKPLAQCAGLFSMLQDGEAAAAVGSCREEIAALLKGGGDEAELKDRLARRVTALGAYVGASRNGSANLGGLLARAGFAPASAPAAAQEDARTVKLQAAAMPAAVLSAVPSDGSAALDKEMLEVFLEEAGEVLAAIETALPASRQAPENAEHLATLRRAFHTLKGSGRMVGLVHLGGAAWEIEQTFNQFVQDKSAGTPDLYRLIALAHERFAHWVADLRASGRASVDAAGLADWARRVRAGEPLPPAEAAASQPAPGTLTATLKMLTVTIGSTSVAPVLYGIFLDEARELIAVLKDFGARLAREPQAAAAPEFLRAAHTLCGISATVGFHDVSELASSLERALQGAGPAGSSLDDAARADVARAVERLSGMVARIAERQPPQAEPALVDALNQTVRTMKVAALPAALEATVAMPAVEAPAAAERRAQRLDDDIDQELLSIFLTEAQELLPQIGQDLRDWRARPDDKLVPQSLKRLLHTLKGSSRMAGAMGLGELTHRMESRVENASLLASVPESLYDELDASYDRLNELIEDLQGKEREPGAASGKLPSAILALSQKMAVLTATGKFRAVAPAPATGKQPTVATGSQQAAPAAAAVEAAAPRAMLRVRAESAERLANQAGEVAIARARAESELRGVRGGMRELTDNIIRLRGQLREIEVQAEAQMQSRVAQADDTDTHFDPLEFDRFTRLQELSRLLAESVNDVATVQQNLMRNLDEGDSALAAQARTTRELQDELLRIRMVPFSSLSDRLYRVARLASKDVGKRVQLDIRGAQAELDRGVLDRIVAPIEHLLRNAIAHGIETADLRKAAGKPEAGEVVLEVRQEGNEVVLGLADDGAGLDLARIRAKAVAQGLMREDESVSGAQIGDFIFRSGFSTADSVSEIAGRGVGMDVVRNEIAGLGGRVEMDTSRGKGTRFTIYLPLTLAVLKAVVLGVGEELYAVPSLLVEQVQSLKPAALAAAYGAREIAWQDARYPLQYLGHLLGKTGATPAQQRFSPVLLLRSGPHRAAIHIDRLLGGQEIVVKNIGPQLARVSGVTGAAVLAGGETVLILNPVPLAQRAAQEVVGQAAVATAGPGSEEKPLEARPAARAAARQATVLVVDDSLTVRKITGRALAREGYNVVAAKDGIDALEKMQAALPDVIVTDVEMPRMDGFDLTRNLRADARLKDLPIIMITSRTADKHRNHAAELGVNVFLGKPYEERELLEHIAGFVHAAA